MTRGFESLRQHREGTKIAHEDVCLLRRTDAPAECALDARAESAKYCNNNNNNKKEKKIMHHATKNGSVKLSNTSLVRGEKTGNSVKKQLASASSAATAYCCSDDDKADQVGSRDD